MTLLAFLLLLIIQYAVAAHAKHIAQAAANQGVQTARAHGSTADAGYADTQAVLDQTAGTILEDRSVDTELTDATATVTVTGRAMTVIPGIRLRVHTSVTAPRERIPGTP